MRAAPAIALALVCACADEPAETEDTAGSSGASTEESSTGGAEATGAPPSDTTSSPDPSESDGPSEGSDSSGGDSGSSTDDGTTGGPPEGAVPMFVALGQGARTMVSCDDGMTWVHDTNVVDDNDDHGVYSSRGLTYGDGVFIAAVGWGNPGSMRVSLDGAAWTETFPSADVVPSGMVGVAFGGGTFVGVEGDTPWISTDSGETWASGEDIPNFDNLRVVGYSGYDGGRFYAAGDAGQLFASADGGQTWQPPQSVGGGGCNGGNLTRRGGVVGTDALFVVVTDAGLSCRTDDGGETFTIHELSPGEAGTVVSGDVVWTGQQFYASSQGRGFFSDDAMSWTEVQYSLPNASVRKLAVSPDTGTFVGFERDGATFYRSTDGEQWVELPPEAAGPGTDITQVVYGYGTPTAECPAPG
ncbi:MAG: hypothetical protein AAF721_02700 [Myxococcota bacterium]